MMDYKFHPAARIEYLDITLYYDGCRAGLGDLFTQEVERSIVRIRTHPDAWPRLSRGTRRCRIRTFPYGVVYAKVGAKLVILAVMHLRRSPRYWQRRLREARN